MTTDHDRDVQRFPDATDAGERVAVYSLILPQSMGYRFEAIEVDAIGFDDAVLVVTTRRPDRTTSIGRRIRWANRHGLFRKYRTYVRFFDVREQEGRRISVTRRIMRTFEGDTITASVVLRVRGKPQIVKPAA